jgi:hypothetical protein
LFECILNGRFYIRVDPGIETHPDCLVSRKRRIITRDDLQILQVEWFDKSPYLGDLHRPLRTKLNVSTASKVQANVESLKDQGNRSWYNDKQRDNQE